VNAFVHCCASLSLSTYGISTPMCRTRSGCCARAEPCCRRAAEQRDERAAFHVAPVAQDRSTLPTFLLSLTSRYCLPASTIVTGLAFLITWPVGASSPDVASTRNVTTVPPCSLAA
jgi:hypothetical protein